MSSKIFFHIVWADSILDYEQQRKDLMHKYGIDLDDGEASGRGTRRLTRKQAIDLMGPPSESDDPGGRVFTWRDQNRRKVCALYPGKDLF